MPVDLGMLTRVDQGQFGAVGGRDRRAHRTVALSYTDAVSQTACWEERSQGVRRGSSYSSGGKTGDSLGCACVGPPRDDATAHRTWDHGRRSSSSSSSTPHHTTPHHTTPHHTTPHHTTPHHTTPHHTTPHHTTPQLGATPAARLDRYAGRQAAPVRTQLCEPVVLEQWAAAL